jgi:thiamine biosynthesis lipoprotein
MPAATTPGRGRPAARSGPGRAARPAGPAAASFPAIGTTALVLVTDPARLPGAEAALKADLAALDAACSRFRADSEIERLATGRWQSVGPLLGDALDAALAAADRSGGLVDPTVGSAVAALGYDRDFADVPAEDPRPATPPRPAPGWWRIRRDPAAGTVLVPHGVRLDLGSTAKAFAADRAAGRIARECGCGVLVSLGGDLAVAGPPPDGGWLVRVGEDHTRGHDLDPVVTVRSGGLATSSVSRRAWRRGGRTRHHIVDPRTGDTPDPVWRAVSVAAGSCLHANTAATAAVVLGAGAPDWLAGLGLPARLVGFDGGVVAVGGWPTGPEAVR